MASSFYIQVLSLGLVWTFFHCSGMCGPLVAGLTARADDPPGRWPRIWLRARRVLAYQSGRAVTYAILGATVGLAGALFEGTIHQIASLSTFVVAPVIAYAGLAKLTGRTFSADAGRKFGSFVTAALRSLRKVSAGRPWLGPFLSGLVLGLLPCMLMFWTLSVASTTASAFHGAGVMITLVVLTTPTLLAAGCATSLSRARWSERAVGVVLLISAAWTALHGLAANDIIPHAELTFRLGGEPYMLMFF